MRYLRDCLMRVGACCRNPVKVFLRGIATSAICWRATLCGPNNSFWSGTVSVGKLRYNGRPTNVDAVKFVDLVTGVLTLAVIAAAEMARWKSDGHAKPAFVILGRIAGYSDDEIERAWEHRDRELVINAALR